MAKGYLGLGPRGAGKGDVICLLYRCTVPLVVRREGSSFQVVGDAYVYGMMKGEMVDKVKEGEFDS